MQRPAPVRRLVAEFLGTTLLLATVIGSGVMGVKLAAGNVALALLANSLATAAMLMVLILILGPISGAHFNPAVTAALAWRGQLSWGDAGAYVLCQIGGGIVGAWLAHLMFELPVLQLSTTVRSGNGQWIAETVATFGLLLTILGCISVAPQAIAPAVGLYIGAAYWFTASTSFANPAVTIARSVSDTFAGIAPASAPPFVCAQMAGAAAALVAAALLWPDPR